MKKFSFLLLTMMLLCCLSSCTGKIAATEPDQPENNPIQKESEVKTGLSVIASASDSTSAKDETAGSAETNISLVALTIDNNGVIRSCEIDSVETIIAFDSAGTLLTDLSDEIYSKNELSEDYGMHAASSIGKEWDEQAEAMADYAIGKTVRELMNIAVDERGAPTDADLSSSVTISIGGFLDGIRSAAESAISLGADADDDLVLVSITDISQSTSADDTSDGNAHTDFSVAAVSFDDERITSCIFDALQCGIRFDTNGKITQLPDSLPTKNRLGRDYGMHTASTIDKDWSEQAAAFAHYAVGKTVDELIGISVDEKGSPTDADLTSSVTLSVSDFQSLLKKADEEE